jgi:hypothetical protein
VSYGIANCTVLGDERFIYDEVEVVSSEKSVRSHRPFPYISVYINVPQSGFGGLVVSMLVPKFAGSNPAEAVGFFGQKNP